MTTGEGPHQTDQHRVEEAIDGGTVATWLAANRIDTVALALVDASGTVRQKMLSPTAAVRALERGWSFIDAIQWWRADDSLGPGAAPGAGTHHAVVDASSGRPYPFGGDATALFFAEFTDPLCRLSPRFVLDQLTERAQAAGFEARVGWEFEYIVLDGQQRARHPENRCWSALTMASAADELAGLTEVLGAGAVPVDHVCAELGPGCFELALGPEAPVRSADSAALAKLYTKAFYQGRGETATFMAKLGPEFPGLGGHPSLSLRSLVDAAPALTESDGTLSKVATCAIAGIVELLPELLLMAAPNVNSFRRFGPGNWAPRRATWGTGNYSCALRVVHDDPETARLELRIPGADISPHHCLAMLLGAALYGIERGLQPPPPCIAPSDGRTPDSGGLLPRDLTEAAERLAASGAAADLYGAPFVAHQADMALAEVTACQAFVSDHERARYLSQV